MLGPSVYIFNKCPVRGGEDLDHTTPGLYFQKYCNVVFIVTPINGLLLPSFNKTDQFINRGTGSVRNGKNQDVCHIAFGSKVLGPPPLSGRRNNMRLSSEVGASFEQLI